MQKWERDMRAKYRYLTAADRAKIVDMVVNGSTVVQIAAALGVHRNTIFNEFRAGRVYDADGNLCYDPIRAARGSRKMDNGKTSYVPPPDCT